MLSEETQKKRRIAAADAVEATPEVPTTPTKAKRTAEEEAAWQQFLLSSPLSDAPEGAFSDLDDSGDERPTRVGHSLFLQISKMCDD